MNLTKLLYDLAGNTKDFDDPDFQGLTGPERNAMGPLSGGPTAGHTEIYVEDAHVPQIAGDHAFLSAPAGYGSVHWGLAGPRQPHA